MSGTPCHAGKSAWGIELSKAVLDKECPDLLKDGYVEAGILTNLPYANSRSDADQKHTLRDVLLVPSDRIQRIQTCS